MNKHLERALGSALTLALTLVSLPAWPSSFQDVNPVLLLPEGRRIVVRNKTCNTCPDPSFVVELPQGSVVGELKAMERQLIISKAATPDGRYLITSSTSGEGVIRVYDLQRQRVIKQFRATSEPGGYSWISISPDGKTLSAQSQWGPHAARSRSLKLYDLGALPSAMPLVSDLSDKGMEMDLRQHALGNAEVVTHTDNDAYNHTRWDRFHLYAIGQGQAKAGLHLDRLMPSAWNYLPGRLVLGFSLQKSLQQGTPDAKVHQFVLLDVDLSSGQARVDAVVDFVYDSSFQVFKPASGDSLCIAYAGQLVRADAGCSARRLTNVDELQRSLQLERRSDGYFTLNADELQALVYGLAWRER